MTRLVIQGTRIRDIASFWAEINRVFMANEDWQLGTSLDALDDLLHGGYGAAAGKDAVTLVWRDIAVSRASLGIEATREWYRGKLARPDLFNSRKFAADLAALEAGHGPTYFDIVLSIIADHPRIALVEA